MPYLWSDFNTELEYILKDPSYVQFPQASRMASYNNAIISLVNYEPNQKSVTLTSGSLTYDLPSDFFEAVAVFDGANWCPAINFTSDSWTSMPNPGTENTTLERSYWIYGNKIGFTKKLSVNGTLYYHGMYTAATSTSSSLDIPTRTKQPIIYWTVAGCINQKLLQQAKIAIWGRQNEPGLTSKSMIDAYNFYWNEGVRLLEGITHKDSEMTLIARDKRKVIR